MADTKKKCLSCGKNKPLNQFYRTNNDASFPDGRYHTCSACVREKIGEENNQHLALFLMEINRPFLKDVWAKAQEKKGHTLGEYMRSIASTPDYMVLSYEDSDVKLDLGKYKIEETRPHIYDREGVIIVLDEQVSKKWLRHNPEYSPEEILELELFFRNMKYDYEIDTTAQESMLEELSVLNIQKKNLLIEKDYTNYAKVSTVYKDTMINAGFRPIDKKDNLEKTGIDSVGEIVAQIERDKGFIPPHRVDYEPDDIDKMLTYYIQWAQRFTDQAVETETIDGWRDIDNDDVNFGVDSSANEDYNETQTEIEDDSHVEQ